MPDLSGGLHVAYLLQDDTQTGAHTAGSRLADGLAKHTDHTVTKLGAAVLDVDAGEPFVRDGDVRLPTTTLVDALSRVNPDVVIAHSVTEDLFDERGVINAMWPTLFRFGINFTESHINGDQTHLTHLPQFIRDFDAILAPSSHAETKVSALGVADERIYVVPPAVDYWDAEPEPSTAPRAVGVVARAAAVKNLPMVPRAIRYYADHIGDPPTVHVAGVYQHDDTLIGHAEALSAAHKFEIHGWVDPAEAIYPRVRAAVLPSLSENCPAVYPEALAAGVPVIAPTSGWALPSDAGTYTADSPESLAKAIEYALDRPGELLGLEREAAPAGFEMQHATDALSDALEAVRERCASFSMHGGET